MLRPDKSVGIVLYGVYPICMVAIALSGKMELYQWGHHRTDFQYLDQLYIKAVPVPVLKDNKTCNMQMLQETNCQNYDSFI